MVDGDTIKVQRGATTETVRLIGLDTPETKDPRKGVQCYGPEASNQAHKLLDGRDVRLEIDPSQGTVDKYGRALAYVWFGDGQLFNEVMIRAGFGREYTYDTHYRYRDRFIAAQEAARSAKAGLWKACAVTPKPDPKAEPAPKPKPKPAPKATDPRFGTCKEAIAAGYGPYQRGVDPEYDWYRDRDGDGVVCER
ncbi:thermonuclease family protein [Actinopolymorpha alba]|uniref:thermonuclease family protein n=1 Tax=Actinopolymorpha alba TaxID=533267 RepID=UPI00058BCDB3|nr:thermonuclease family protein [Actinopolymorpha alba]